MLLTCEQILCHFPVGAWESLTHMKDSSFKNDLSLVDEAQLSEV